MGAHAEGESDHGLRTTEEAMGEAEKEKGQHDGQSARWKQVVE